MAEGKSRRGNRGQRGEGGTEFVGSRWWCPSWLEVPGGPWGASGSFHGDVAAGWKAAIDWHAEHGMNVIIADIPYSQTDRSYIGWGFHYILDFQGWPHAQDLFSHEFRRRNIETLRTIFAHGRKRGVTCIVHHFNFLAPRRMAVAEGWLPRYPKLPGDMNVGGMNPDNLGLLAPNCCWHVPSYQKFMKQCWAQTLKLLPGLGGFLVTIGEASRGNYPEDYPIRSYDADRRYAETAVDFTKTYAAAVRSAGGLPLVRVWGVEWLRHRMPKDIDYLIKYQLFDCIDAPADELVEQWVKHGHRVWAEADLFGENAGPIQWVSTDYFRSVGTEARRIQLRGIVSHVDSGFEVGLLDTPSACLNMEMFVAGQRAPAALDDAARWVDKLKPSFGAAAGQVYQALEKISRGALSFSKVFHRVGEGFTFGWAIPLAPVRRFPCNLGLANGTPPRWCRGNLITLKEYLDYLSINPWEEGCLETLRGGRDCPIDLMRRCAAEAQEAEKLVELAKPDTQPKCHAEWKALRCSAALCRWQSTVLAAACQAKVLFAAVRSSIDPQQQKQLAGQCLESLAELELGYARIREWMAQLPPTHLAGQSTPEALKRCQENYKDVSFEVGLYRRELQRLLDGEVWTLSLRELAWKGLMVNEIYEESPTAFAELRKCYQEDVPWPPQRKP